ncbi:MAG: ribonuclease E/G [bacterium]
MKKTLIIDSLFSHKRIVLLEDENLKEIIIEDNFNNNIKFNIDDIFIGKIKKILPQKFAFVDLGYDKNVFLGLNDRKQNALYSYDENKKNFKLNVKEGQDILVQIDRAGTEIKGASVTTNLTLTGKYVILLLDVQNKRNVSVSKKIDNKDLKEDLIKIGQEEVDTDGFDEKLGIIFRTSCNNIDINEESTKLIIKEEISKLVEKAYKIKNQSQYVKAPALIHDGKSELEKLIIDIMDEEQDEIIVNSNLEYENLVNIFKNIKLYDNNVPIFENYSIENKIQKALQKKVWLNCGGFLVIEQVEAMTVIDVNTGKNTTKNFEKMVLKTNKEAVVEIAHQIRLRNISGMILIDFVDMKNREYITEIKNLMMIECKKDRMPVIIYDINELGIMQLTRKKYLQPLHEVVNKVCPTCLGEGVVRNELYVAHTIKNQIISIFSNTIYDKVKVSSSGIIINCLQRNVNIKEIEEKFNKEVEVEMIVTAKFDYFEIEYLK